MSFVYVMLRASDPIIFYLREMSCFVLVHINIFYVIKNNLDIVNDRV